MKSRLLLFGLCGLSLLFQTVALAADTLPADRPAGATTLPWITYDAKDAVVKGEMLTSNDRANIACESASGSCVRLNAVGDSVAWKARGTANAIVVRYSIPDAPAGGGASGTLALFVNGTFRQKIDLTSHFTWLYGAEENGQSNDPTLGSPHHFFDEAHAFITGAPLQPGDVVSLRRQTDDSLPWCVVDLIDLETAPPPATMPAGSLSIADFGAVPDDGKDDTAAIEACLVEAKKEGKAVWFPVGTFDQMRILKLDGVVVLGAGPWYTRLTAPGLPAPSMGFKGNCGFNMTGSGSQVRDMMIEGSETSRRDPQQRALVGSPQNFAIENVWVEHTGTGVWIGSCAHGVIRDCRFRDTYADGLNLNNDAQDIVVEQNDCRGTGDDALAVFSATDKGGKAGPCVDIDIRHNTVDAPWWANCVGVYGGRHIVVEKNLLRGGNRACGVAVTTGYNVWPSDDFQILNNEIIRAGGFSWKQPWGAILVYTPGTAIHGLNIQGNHVVAAKFDAVELLGLDHPGTTMELTLAENEIDQPGGAFLHIKGPTHGSVLLRKNKIIGLAAGQTAIVNQASPANFQIEDEDVSP